MKLINVAITVFYQWKAPDQLQVWVQRRLDDGPYHGLLEFPGGGIESGESPLEAAIREVEEEVGIQIDPEGSFPMGIYSNEHATRTILLHVFLFPDQPELKDQGQWLTISKEYLSSNFKGIIPPPNHRIIDDLYQHLYEEQHE